MKRRELIAGLGSAAVWQATVRAQQSGKIYRIGFITAATNSAPYLLNAFRDSMRTLGWIEGENVVYEARYAENRLDRLSELAAELVRLNVDVIVTSGTLAPSAAKQTTTTIPIVMTAAGDPSASGLVASLARPGGNITGLSLMAPDLAGKRLELLKEFVPELSRVAVLWNAPNPYPALVFKETQHAARTLKIEVQSLEVRSPNDLETALDAAIRQHANALITVDDPLTVSLRQQIADFAIKNRLPTIFGLREFVDAGGLLSYGANLADLFRRAAGYVDKIIRGAKPSEIPVEQPIKFELVINLKTVKALDIGIPPSLLARADEIIE
jgi:putative ABC transport system substrate-binding protein